MVAAPAADDMNKGSEGAQPGCSAMPARHAAPFYCSLGFGAADEACKATTVWVPTKYDLDTVSQLAHCTMTLITAGTITETCFSGKGCTLPGKCLNSQQTDADCCTTSLIRSVVNLYCATRKSFIKHLRVEFVGTQTLGLCLACSISRRLA